MHKRITFWLERSVDRWLLWAVPLLLCTAAALWFLFFQNTPATVATWIWETRRALDEKEEVLAFAKTNGINLLYLYIDQSVAPEQYRSFIKSARQAGMKVEALGGDPYWALKANRESIRSFIQWVKTYNETAKEEERFHGIHVDIEPHLLPKWKEEQAAIIKQWVENIDYFVKETKKDPNLVTGADLPFWIDELTIPGEAKRVSDWMMERLDSITIMAYRDFARGPNGILDIVETLFERAEDRQKASVLVAVNIRKTQEAEHVSFHGKGLAKMEQELAVVQAELDSYSAFAGYAVHDYASWRRAASLRQ
jgi:hypothetical protein